MAERCYPGIGVFYRRLTQKPATFLQLVWAFEADRATPATNQNRPRPRTGR